METVLLLEDDADCRSGTSQILQFNGYDVTEAATAAQALEIFTQNGTIDVLVTDVGLPDASGPDVALQVVERRPRLPILFVSATPPEAWGLRDRSLFKRLQSKRVDFLEKPFRVAVLFQKLNALLGHGSSVAG